MADENGSDGNVVDISAGKPKKRRKRDGTGEPTPEETAAPPPDRGPGKGLLYRAVGLAIDRSEYSLLPAFPRRFIVVEPVLGIRQPLEVDEETGVCTYVDVTHVRNAILAYVTNECAGRPGYAWEARHARDCAEHWLALARPVKEPPAVRWQGEEGLCFNRLPWEFCPGAPAPTFEGLFARISNNQALIGWIGSLFEPEADRQQYVWLYGHGGDGKGALVRFLKKVLGLSFAAKQVPGRDDVHWTAGLIGKRLVVFPDTNSAAFPASGLFMTLSGGDPVDINPKHKAPYCAELFAKFLFLSNARPSLSSEKSHMRRAIYCAFSSGPEAHDPHFEEKLWAEGGAFLSTCIDNYRYEYPKHGPIKSEMDELADWVSVVEESFEVAFERRLEAIPLPPAGVAPQQYVLPHQMQEIMKEERFDRVQQSKFLSWLERMHGVAKRNIKIDGASRKVYIGVRARSYFEQTQDGYT